MAVTSFIPELWNARLLHALDNNHVATNLVNRNYEGEIRQAGDTVHINSIGAINVNNYQHGTSIVFQELTTTDQTLAIDQEKYFAFQIDDVDAAQAAGDLMDEAMSRSAYALADVADTFLLGKIAAGGSTDNYIGSTGSPVALTAANIYANIVGLRTKLDKKNVPMTGRSVVVPPEVYALLLQDERFTKVDSLAQGTVVNGLVGRVAGFDVFETNNVTKSSSTFIITAQVPDATTYAEQIVKTEALRLENSFKDGVKGLHVYGAKVVRPEEIATLFATVS